MSRSNAPLEALRRAVNRCIAEGAPVYENVPAVDTWQERRAKKDMERIDDAIASPRGQQPAAFDNVLIDRGVLKRLRDALVKSQQVAK